MSNARSIWIVCSLKSFPGYKIFLELVNLKRDLNVSYVFSNCMNWKLHYIKQVSSTLTHFSCIFVVVGCPPLIACTCVSFNFLISFSNCLVAFWRSYCMSSCLAWSSLFSFCAVASLSFTSANWAKKWIYEFKSKLANQKSLLQEVDSKVYKRVHDAGKWGRKEKVGI